MSVQTDVTGESEHERLEDVEVIFGAFEEIDPHALRQCWNLQRLTRTLVVVYCYAAVSKDQHF